MAAIYYSPDGLPEVHESRPKGYMTEDAWLKKQAELREQEEQERLRKFYEPETAAKRHSEAIDEQTSRSILDGFDYTVNGEELHFSYDAFDQQNFADTANACLMAQAGVEGLPSSVVWNAYRKIPKEAEQEIRLPEDFPAEDKAKAIADGSLVERDGKTFWKVAYFDLELVQVTLDVPGFLALYAAGALAHKAACMARGGQRKAAVRQALADGVAGEEIVKI